MSDQPVSSDRAMQLLLGFLFVTIAVQVALLMLGGNLPAKAYAKVVDQAKAPVIGADPLAGPLVRGYILHALLAPSGKALLTRRGGLSLEVVATEDAVALARSYQAGRVSHVLVFGRLLRIDRVANLSSTLSASSCIATTATPSSSATRSGNNNNTGGQTVIFIFANVDYQHPTDPGRNVLMAESSGAFTLRDPRSLRSLSWGTIQDRILRQATPNDNKYFLIMALGFSWPVQSLPISWDPDKASTKTEEPRYKTITWTKPRS